MKDVKIVRKILLKILRWTGWIFASLTVLLLLSILVIRIPSVQNKLTQQAISFLKNRIGTEVQLEHIYISFPKKIVLKGLYLEDQAKDTLFYAGVLSLDTDLWGLTRNHIALTVLELTDCTTLIKRSATDSTFNFTYIIEAFTDAVADTTTTPWKFSVEDVSVLKTSFLFQDQLTGNTVRLTIGTMELTMDEFDPAESIYAVESVTITDTHAEIIQSKLAVPDTSEETSSSLPRVDFTVIELNNTKIQYKNAAGQHIQADLGKFRIEANEFDLIKNTIDIDQIEIKGSALSYRQDQNEKGGSSVQKMDSVIRFSGLNIPWNISINAVTLTDNRLRYDDFNMKPVNGMIDFNHLFVFGLQLSGKNFVLNGNTLNVAIENLSLQEKSGFTLQSFSANLGVTDTQLDLNKFILHAGNSKINLKGSASYPSLARYEEAKFEFQLDQSTLAIKDILFLSPTLLDSLPLELPETTTILIDTKVTGTLADLTINRLTLKTLSNTTLALQGNIKGLPNSDRVVLKIELHKFYTVASDVQLVLVDSLIPAFIQLPEWIELQGNYTGTTKVSAVQALFTSDAGDAEAHGKISLSSIPTYDLVIKTTQLHLGKILKQPQTMGMLDMQASVKGSGLTMDTLSAVFDVTVDQFQYKQYNYKNFKLEGKLHNYLFSGTGSLHDEHLDFILAGDFDYQHDVPLYNFTLALKNANFQKLNLSERPLKARGTLDINLSTSDFQIINGDMAIRKVAIYNGESLYMVDSLLFASIDQEGESNMTIQSDIISGEFTGTFNLFSLASVMRQHINQYFSLQDNTITTFLAPQNFKFDLTLKSTDLITEILIPDLDSFIPGKISGEFNSIENKLAIEIDIARIKYATTSVDSLSVLIISDSDALNYTFRLKNINQDTLTIDAVQLTGKIQNDSIHSVFQILNSENEKKYILGGVIKSQEDKFRFQFHQDQVVLNYTEWQVPEDNYLDFNVHGIQAHNFVITGGAEKIALITTVKDSTISVEFQDLQLSSLTRVVRGVMPANGKLNGTLKFTTAAQGRFNSKLQIDRLEILEQPYGDLTLMMSHADNRYGIDLLIKNEESNLKAEGYYRSDKTISEFMISVTLSPLSLKLIEPFTYGQLKNIKGIARGKLQLSGNFDIPVVRGEITFHDATFTSTYLNNTFYLANESISFEESGIAFTDFTISDSVKNTAVLQGDILTRAYKDFRFNLRLSARDFQVLNTTEEDNKLFYGSIKLNTVTRISGNSNRPKVDMVVNLSKGSELTYVVPQTQKSVMEQKGIVQFVDKDAALDPFLADINLGDTIASAFSGIDISANVELSDQETLNIVIDPITGDRLSVKGNSTLTYDMTASGNMNLSGRYEISEGSYDLSFYKFVKRKFAIEKGGTIIWSGNPLNAQLDIRARYEVDTSPIDLISNQINTTDQEQLNSYRQRLPFYVLLDIKGQLLAPQITFQIDMPVEKRGAFGGAIYAKLNDINSRESDVNKQVFALLILKRFVSDNPLESQGGSDVANATRTSVSRILSDQFNRLSENIKGIQLSVDIKSYENYSTGEAQGDTQVQLGVSKSLFNDRLVVKLSGNVDVEGENTSQENVSDYIGDLALEYKLTSDGRFRVTGFRTSNYDMIDGELIETGAGLIYIKDYNTLRELFKRNAKVE